MKNRKYLPDQGFTLIELLVVIVVIGIIFAMFSSALLSYIEKSRIYKTQTRMEVIQDAIDKFLNINDRLPCPAPQNVGPGAPGFNVEITTPGIPGALANCNVNASPAGAPVFTNGAVRLRTGAVPTRSINLPDEYALDAWGNKFRYTVTRDIASPGLYDNDGGRIAVRDSANLPTVNPPDTAHYVVVSHGENGLGAFAESGAAVGGGCGATAAGGLERQNCNNNRRYVSTLLKSDVLGAGYYDDFVVFKAEERPDFQVPAGAVVAFNGPCPPTWQPADGVPAGEPDLQGRFVIGRTMPGSPINSPRYNNITATAFTDNLSYTIGNTGQDPIHLIPPYIALQYCIKD